MNILNTKEITLKHLISAETLSNEEVFALINLAKEFKNPKKVIKNYKNYFVSNLFFENSTRTHKSFEVAESKLGFNIIPFETEKSSINKGETLYDTVLTLSAIGIDILVIRHKKENYYKELIENSSINCSIINGGDGTGQHPSQSLLDIMTIYEEFKTFENLNIAIIGDIMHSRVAKSNISLLKNLGANLYFSGPKEWWVEDFKAYGNYEEIDKLIKNMDVVMLLRVQHERHKDKINFSKENYNKEYGLTLERYNKMKKNAIIMHPAPINRDVEIDSNLVESEKSRIVNQMRNGVFMRMAILQAIMNYKERI